MQNSPERLASGADDFPKRTHPRFQSWCYLSTDSNPFFQLADKQKGLVMVVDLTCGARLKRSFGAECSLRNMAPTYTREHDWHGIVTRNNNAISGVRGGHLTCWMVSSLLRSHGLAKFAHLPTLDISAANTGSTASCSNGLRCSWSRGSYRFSNQIVLEYIRKGVFEGEVIPYALCMNARNKDQC